MSDKNKDFMSFFDSIDKIGSEDSQDFPVENIQDEREVLEFLDGIVNQKFSKEQNEKQSDNQNLKKDVSHEKSLKTKSENEIEEKRVEKTWFEGILDNTSFFFKQAEEKVKQFQHLDGKKIEERVSHIMDIDTLGKYGNQFKSNAIHALSSTFNSMLNIVAPPISSHEILEIEIYHNLTFFPKLDKILYSIFDEAVSYIEGKDIIVQKGKKDIPETELKKSFHIFEELETAINSAKTCVTPFLDLKQKKIEFSDSLPVYISQIHISIQAYSFNLQNISLNDKEKKSSEDEKMLCFVIYLNDPYRKIELNTQSQALPIQWIYQLNNININPKLSINNLNLIIEKIERTLQLSIAIIAQSYIEKRNKNDFVEK
ncbi:hypothetical protein PORY_002351 [Pneumocystis oryctolagi]|uniref:Uncharacterized protein n=1 Tax=Pneumocystis oryctolagi TaxID=42067 RepID=A0ACB7C9W7_9ASCO|nr:hypothetical protein PORY_002351 [Pneumocystis oryctolagi]